MIFSSIVCELLGYNLVHHCSTEALKSTFSWFAFDIFFAYRNLALLPTWSKNSCALGIQYAVLTTWSSRVWWQDIWQPRWPFDGNFFTVLSVCYLLQVLYDTSRQPAARTMRNAQWVQVLVLSIIGTSSRMQPPAYVLSYLVPMSYSEYELVGVQSTS